MAKDDKNQAEELTFMGRAVDPNIQKKVDEYMELEDTEVPKSSGSQKIEIKAGDSQIADEDAGSAPLLPTEQLPEIIKDDTKETEQELLDEEPINEDTAITDDALLSEAPENVDEEQNLSVEPDEVELAEDEPLDSEIIDLEDNNEPEAETSDEEIDTSKTIEEITSDNSSTMDDEQLEEAISDIVAEDSDKLLEAEDKNNTGDQVPLGSKIASSYKPSESKENIFKRWFKNPISRNITFVILALLIIASLVIPTSRYSVLNLSGVRVSASLKILDDKTSLPLKNVEVSASGKTVKTDDNGEAKLQKVKLGKQDITIKKLAFGEVKKTVTLGLGSNPLGEQRLTPTGAQYTFVAKDYVSDQPMANAEVSYGESSAKFNSKGEAILTVPASDKDSIEVKISSKDYREESIKIATNTKDKTELKMVPAKKHVFVSKRSGKFDLYQSYIDGKNQEVVMAGTGIEKEESLSLTTNPSAPMVAYASSRENTRNQDGFLLTTLDIINLDTKEVTKVTQSERIQLIDWSGSRLIYVKITQGASAANVNRHKLMSYDTESGTEKELASTNYFNDVVSVNGAVYYTPAAYQINGKVGLYKVNADGTNKKTVYDKEVWNIFRTSFDKFSLSVGQDWYELSLANDEIKKIGGAPSVLKSRVYINNSDQKQSIWVDERDGKSVLLDYNVSSKADRTLVSENGIKNPIYWLDSDHVIYRVSNSRETADYVMSLSGGTPKKIADVTNTVGVDRWYYY